MIFLAALQALLTNLANAELTFANQALAELDWIDQFLQKGTLWLAFLGASLAAQADRHIAIDALARVVPGRVRLVMKAIVCIAASVTSWFLARTFFDAIRIIALERPLEYEVLTMDGAEHICTAPAQALTDSHLSRPDLFCGMRSALDAMGIQVETPIAALQLIVPAMFLVIAIRFFARFIGATVSLVRGEADGDKGALEKVH